jgi:beta-glucosidase
MMWGNYNGTPNHTVSILSGIKSKYKNIEYIKGCDLTDLKIVKPFFDQCSFEGKKGLKGTFWSNINMEGEPVSTEFYNAPFAVTTAGMHVFAPNVPVEDFSAKYETTFVPEKSGEVVLNVESCGHFEVYVNGKQVQRHHTWRTTPTRTPLQVTKGEKYNIEIRYQFVKTWGANMKVNIGEEQPINYNETIAKLKGINKVIFVGGISPALEGEEMPVRIEGFAGGDRTSIELPKVQRDFIAALKKAGKQIIYVNCSGSAIALTPETKNCEAIVQAWYAGQEGGTAVADILFGDVNPSGKLPVTFYTDDSQLTDFEDYSMQNRTYRYFKGKPLFSFGYGLSYTTFKIGKATIINGKEGKDDVISIPVTNTGKKEGTEIVQLYVKDPKDVSGPQLTLKGFQRISLKPGETATVKLSLGDKVRELFDASTNTVHPINHTLNLYYGTSSVKENLNQINY